MEPRYGMVSLWLDSLPSIADARGTVYLCLVGWSKLSSSVHSRWARWAVFASSQIHRKEMMLTSTGGALIAEEGIEEKVNQLRFSPDGRVLGVGTLDSTLVLAAL